MLIIIIFLIAPCNGALEFNSRARNFSIELIYFTHLKVEHFVMSPFCVWSVMTSAYLGGHGDTSKEILKAAVILKNNTVFFKKFKNLTNILFESKSSGVELTTATFLFQDEQTSVREYYKVKLNQIYKALVRILDFEDTLETKIQANRAVQNVFPTIWNAFHANDFKEASVILSNVIYFRGLLSTPFNVSHTTEEIIYNENNVAIGSVTMMHQKGKLRYSNFETMNSHILELPYGYDGKFCMLVIFPYPGVNLMDVYKKLAYVSMRDIFTKLEKDFNEKELKEVDVKLPRFSIRTSMTLNQPLSVMGMYDAFEPDWARFDGISREHLYIHTIEHKANIIFAEHETVAFATTPGYFDQHRYSSNLKAQQPFIFFLMEKPTASVLFGGIYSRHRYLN